MIADNQCFLLAASDENCTHTYDLKYQPTPLVLHIHLPVVCALKQVVRC